MSINHVDYPIDQLKGKTKQSALFIKQAKGILPDGVTANIKSFDPYPITMKKGGGAYLEDIDGNVYITHKGEVE